MDTASRFSTTPEPPYYAVIFTSKRTPGDNGYGETAEKMAAFASRMPGFLGLEHAADGELGITVSYWMSETDIARWKQQMDHYAAQESGKSRWYKHYELRVAKVERAYSGPEGR